MRGRVRVIVYCDRIEGKPQKVPASYRQGWAWTFPNWYDDQDEGVYLHYDEPLTEAQARQKWERERCPICGRELGEGPGRCGGTNPCTV